MSISKKVVGAELYVYFEGRLIYKHWITPGWGMGRVFHENEGLTQYAR